MNCSVCWATRKIVPRLAFYLLDAAQVLAAV
jgi:hypothetical protein